MKLSRAGLAALLFLAAGLAFARKTFPATPESVLEENLKADELGLPRYANEQAVQEAIEAGELVPLTVTCDHRLPQERRYARPAAVSFVELLEIEMHPLRTHILVTSAVRPVTVQAQLRRTNVNAAEPTGDKASSHETGNTLDISARGMSYRQHRWLIGRLRYYRDRGDIFVIEEKSCIHIFIAHR